MILVDVMTDDTENSAKLKTRIVIVKKSEAGGVIVRFYGVRSNWWPN